jgi:hypothetical protein
MRPCVRPTKTSYVVIDDDGCSNLCKAAAFGDGTVQQGEQCTTATSPTATAARTIAW